MSDFASALGRHFPHALTLRLPAAPPVGGKSSLDTAGQTGDIHGLDFVALCTPEGLTEKSTLADFKAKLRLTVTSCVSGIFEKELDMDGLAALRSDAGMREFSWDVFLRLLSDALQGKKGCSTIASLMDTTRVLVLGELSPGQQREAPARPEPCTRLTLRFQLEAAALITQFDIPKRSLPPGLDASTEAYLLELRRFLLDALGAARTEGMRDAVPSTQLTSASRQLGSLAAKSRGTHRVDMLEDRLPRGVAASGSATVKGVEDGAGAMAPLAGPLQCDSASRSLATLPPPDSSALTVSGSHASSRSLPAGGAALTICSTSTNVAAAKRAAVQPKKRCGGSLVDPRARKAPKGNPFQLQGA